MPKKLSLSSQKKELKSDLFTPEGKKSGEILLDSRIFGVKAGRYLLAQAVRVYLANQRAGSHDAKTRSEVTGTTKKIYKQKGTGRARHGDRKAPIFIKGGKAHGPKPRDYSMKLNRKMRRKALFIALSEKFRADSIKFIKGLTDITPKTKNMAKVLKNMDLTGKSEKDKTLLIIQGGAENISKAARNIKLLNYIPFQLLNAYEILVHKNIIFTKEALDGFQKFSFKETLQDPKKKEEKKAKVKRVKRIGKIKKLKKAKVK